MYKNMAVMVVVLLTACGGNDGGSSTAAGSFAGPTTGNVAGATATPAAGAGTSTMVGTNMTGASSAIAGRSSSPPTSTGMVAQPTSSAQAGTMSPVAGGRGGSSSGSAGASGAPSIVMATAGAGAGQAGNHESAAGSGSPPTTGSKPACLKAPGQVAMLGDSYVAAPSFIGPAVVAAAVADHALQSGQTYADYSAPGTTLLSGQIPGQLDQAIRANPGLRTVITDGGGNDIIGSGTCLSDGASKDTMCTMLVGQLIKSYQDMATKSKTAGVTDFIIFLYPDNVPIGGGDILRYSVAEGQKLAQQLNTSDFRVYLLDTAPLMKDHPDWYSDGLIHVNAQGAKLIGDAVYKIMKDHCIAQPASSGCCDPG